MDYIMTTDKLTKVYGSKAAAKDVSIHIREGEIYGLIGRNGAGKTTVMRMLSGLSNPTSGSFTMFGKTGAEAKKLMHKVGVLIEHPGLYPTLSARENLKIKAIALGVKTPNRVVSELLELVGMVDKANNYPAKLSGGQQQRISIARYASAFGHCPGIDW